MENKKGKPSVMPLPYKPSFLNAWFLILPAVFLALTYLGGFGLLSQGELSEEAKNTILLKGGIGFLVIFILFNIVLPLALKGSTYSPKNWTVSAQWWHNIAYHTAVASLFWFTVFNATKGGNSNIMTLFLVIIGAGVAIAVALYGIQSKRANLESLNQELAQNIKTEIAAQKYPQPKTDMPVLRFDGLSIVPNQLIKADISGGSASLIIQSLTGVETKNIHSGVKELSQKLAEYPQFSKVGSTFLNKLAIQDISGNASGFTLKIAKAGEIHIDESALRNL
jgi:hypothetical protein